MKKIKILCIALLILVSIGCNKDNEKPIDPLNPPVENPEDTVNDLINKLPILVISKDMKSDNEETAFSISSVSEVLSPALTYNTKGVRDEISKEVTIPDTSDENDNNSNNNESTEKPVNINISNELLLEIAYNKKVSNDKPTKVLLDDIKIITTPKKGSLKFYGIVEGNNYNYIDLMRKNEIVKNIEYKKDLLNNKLEDGKIALMFSSTIENIMQTSYESLQSSKYDGVLKNDNISFDDLKFSIKFNVIIYTSNSIYALPFEYSNTVDVYAKEHSKLYTFEKTIFFKKIK